MRVGRAGRESNQTERQGGGEARWGGQSKC